MIRKLLAIIFFAVGLAGLALSVGGVIIGRQLVDSLGNGLDRTLELTVDSLDTAQETLLLTRSTLVTVSDGLATVGDAAGTVSTGIYESQPMLAQVNETIAIDVADGLEAVEEAIPNVAEAAGAIDDALILLDRFQVDRRVLGVPIRFNLGIDYDPNLPLDETVLELGGSLDGLPEELRSLEDDLTTAETNLGRIGASVDLIAEDLAEINESVKGAEPLIKDYIRLVSETGDLIRQSRASLGEQLELTKTVVTVLFVWIGLSQIVPLYLATQMVVPGNDTERAGEVEAEEVVDES